MSPTDPFSDVQTTDLTPAIDELKESAAQHQRDAEEHNAGAWAREKAASLSRVAAALEQLRATRWRTEKASP